MSKDPVEKFKIKEFLEPYLYLGCVGKNELDAAAHLANHRPKFDPSLAVLHNLMPAYYITEEGVDRLSNLDRGQLPIIQILVKKDKAEGPSMPQYREAWMESARTICKVAHEKGMELAWSGKALSHLKLSSWSVTESVYRHKETSLLSDLVVNAIYAEAEEAKAPKESAELVLAIVHEYNLHDLAYYFPYEKIEKHFNVETIYNLDKQTLLGILTSMREGKVWL